MSAYNWNGKLVYVMSGLIATIMLASCGKSPKSDIKIIGGTAVTEKDPLARRVAALVNPANSVRCSVAAIAPNRFITAAHCIPSTNLNGWTIQSGTTVGSKEILDVSAAKVHPKFTPALLYSSLTPSTPPYDLAVVETIEQTKGTIPVPIFRKKPGIQMGASSAITIAGYGRTDGTDPNSKGSLQKVDVTITKFNQAALEFLTENSDGKMGCHGDSGGPAFRQIGKVLMLVGTVSRGDNSCVKGTTVFTDLSEYEEFLSEFLSK